jgi:hypothetical protein
MHHTPLTWYEQENQSYQAHLRFFSKHSVFASVVDERWHIKALHLGANGPHTLAKTHQFTSNSIMQTRQIVAVTKGMQHDSAFLLSAHVTYST